MLLRPHINSNSSEFPFSFPLLHMLADTFSSLSPCRYLQDGWRPQSLQIVLSKLPQARGSLYCLCSTSWKAAVQVPDMPPKPFRLPDTFWEPTPLQAAKLRLHKRRQDGAFEVRGRF